MTATDGYPRGTFLCYGPDDNRTTKIVAGVIQQQGAEPILKQWVGNTIHNAPRVMRQAQEFFKQHCVLFVTASIDNIGCHHEEGHDYPIGEDCPFCPFWKGKQGTARRE